MSTKNNSRGDKGKRKVAAGFSKARQMAEQRSRRRQADREKRQELARLRHEASRGESGPPKDRHKTADGDRLKGKGLFYCPSPVEREKEIQRRRSEANEAGTENRQEI